MLPISPDYEVSLANGIFADGLECIFSAANKINSIKTNIVRGVHAAASWPIAPCALTHVMRSHEGQGASILTVPLLRA